MADAPLTPCGDCGMPGTPNDYHPYAACLMFKACHSSEVVRANLQAVVDHCRPQPPAAPLTVTVTHMRESNGNEWWSACLYRDTGKTMAFANGYEFYQSPIKGRADYEADCMRKLLDPTLPDVDILAYDTDAPPITTHKDAP